eukprot:Gb_08776 [translate_table: standard]
MGGAEHLYEEIPSRDSEPSSLVGTFKFFSRLLRLIKNKKTKSSRTLSIDSVHVQAMQKPSEEIKMDPEARFTEEKEQKECPSATSCNSIDDGESRSRGSILRQAVKKLHFGNPEEKWRAALEIQRIATESVQIRKSLSLLGVIPSLIAMLDSPVRHHCHAALQALIELANENYTNKALIVEAGAVDKLSKLLNTSDSEMQESIAIALLAISAVDKSIIRSSGVLPSLIRMLESGTQQSRMAALAALYNLSTCLDNVDSIVRKGAMKPLLNMAQEVKTGEIALAILGNLVVTRVGRKTIESEITVPKCLIDILRLENSSKCKELAAYILMLLAHRSLLQRKAMKDHEIVPVLVELALLGTDLARERALRIIKCVKEDGQAATMAVSGPVTTGMWEPRRESSSRDNMTEMKEHKRAVKHMVQKSLQRNMERIVKRANVPSAYVDSSTKLKTLINSSSSKSLPY